MVSICTLLARKWDIADIVHRLSAQTFKDIEWVIIDFYYDDNKEFFERTARYFGLRLIHRPNVRGGSTYMRDIARNRNEALVHASGDVIIFLDDYTAIDDTFVESHYNLVGRGNISCGYMYYFKENIPLSLVDDDGYPVSIGNLLREQGRYDSDSREQVFVEKGITPNKPTPVLGSEWTYTGNLAFSWEVAEKMNGFDPRLSARGEDGDFGLRANALGYSIIFNPDAKSINLCTDEVPCKKIFDHDHPVDYFLEKDALIAADHQVAIDMGYDVVTKYGTEFVICQKCDAEFMLNPAKFIYQKLREEDFVVDKKLFDLIERRNNR